MRKIKFNNTIKAIGVLVIAHIVTALLVFGEINIIYLPEFGGLYLGNILIELFSWVPMISAYYYLYRVIRLKECKNDLIIQEQKYYMGVVFVIFLIGVSTGIHACGQILESIALEIGSIDLYEASYFFEEYIGHLTLPLMIIVVFFLVIMELNRKGSVLNRFESFLLIIFSIINGFFFALGGIEGGSMYLLVVPVVAISLLVLFRVVRTNDLSVKKYPFTKYFVYSSITMILLTFFWVVKYGLTTQLTELMGVN